MSTTYLAARAKTVQGALAFLKGTALEAGKFERYLLEEYLAGRLTLEQVRAQIAAAELAESQVAPKRA